MVCCQHTHTHKKNHQVLKNLLCAWNFFTPAQTEFSQQPLAFLCAGTDLNEPYTFMEMCDIQRKGCTEQQTAVTQPVGFTLCGDIVYSMSFSDHEVEKQKPTVSDASVVVSWLVCIQCFTVKLKVMLFIPVSVPKKCNVYLL